MLQIGNVKIENKLILAPMAGITNLPYRLIVKDEGCGLVVSEMVSAIALLRDALKIKVMIEAVRAAVTIPFTVKIRSGWDSKSTNYLEIGRIAEECGVDAITLHSRTTAQGFGGMSDWSHIAELKKALKIPVIGNGDIKTPEDAKRMLDETSCDGTMIGRGGAGT